MNFKLTGKVVPILEYMIYICIDIYSIPLYIFSKQHKNTKQISKFEHEKAKKACFQTHLY